MTHQISFLGTSDAGKTSLAEKLMGKSLPKYRLEQKAGMTMKTGYGDLQLGGRSFYILDLPGHQAYCHETLRNIDLSQIVVYVIDGGISRGTLPYKRGLDHYDTMRVLMKKMKKPMIVCINKADSATDEQILLMYRDYATRGAPSAVIPTSAKSDHGLLLLREELIRASEVPALPHPHPPAILARVIKSYNVNRSGVPLTQVKGGVLGLYQYTPLSGVNVSHTNVFCDDLAPVSCENIITHNDSITTLETLADPCLYKNDHQKGTLLVDYDNFHRTDLCTGPLELRVAGNITLNKGDRLTFLILGQTLSGILKGSYRERKQTVLTVTPDKIRHPIITPKGQQGIIIYHKAQIDHVLLELATIV